MSLALPSYMRRSMERTADAWRAGSRRLAGWMPKGLFQRALLIVILPVVLLQSAIAYFFMERHWQQVTMRLSASVVSDIATVIDLYELNPTLQNFENLTRIARQRQRHQIELLGNQPLPPAQDKPFFSFLDRTLAHEISQQIRRPFWLDTIGKSRFVEIRVQMKDNVLRVITHRNQAYVSNSHIFILWMVGTSLVLLAVAIAFLRGQIRPILRLARAAEAFGKGRDTDFRPHGAREVRRAGQAFIEMRERIERALEQRTAMLSGVSHDLRTILTRFRLSLAFLPDTPEAQELRADVDEMQRMLVAYLDFARGASGESAAEIDLVAMLEQMRTDTERTGKSLKVAFAGNAMAVVRPDSFKRLLSNLISNAQRYGKRVEVGARHGADFLEILIDDDGPGIPPERYEDVFRPFFRLDEARNQDEGGTGLGLAIARDIARSHGGDVTLAKSPLGGLRAVLNVPV
ncbi:MAG: HAMP domain-containing protein [Alphaproteobacteria bacterium]|nr:HAMP domain-containing protein [Alphaproteobacteria bacterium]